MGGGLYTIVVTWDGKREVVNSGWRMALQQAEHFASEYTERYSGIGRFYQAMNVNRVEEWLAERRGPV